MRVLLTIVAITWVPLLSMGFARWAAGKASVPVTGESALNTVVVLWMVGLIAAWPAAIVWVWS